MYLTSIFNTITEGDGRWSSSEKIFKYKIYGTGEDEWEEVGQMDGWTPSVVVVVPISMEKTMLDQCEATFHGVST